VRKRGGTAAARAPARRRPRPELGTGDTHARDRLSEAGSGPAELPALELEVLDFWDDDDTFARASPAAMTRRNTCLDGPPFANGLPHYGHLRPAM